MKIQEAEVMRKKDLPVPFETFYGNGLPRAIQSMNTFIIEEFDLLYGLLGSFIEEKFNAGKGRNR